MSRFWGELPAYQALKRVARFESRYADYGRKKVFADMWNEFYKQRLTEDAAQVGLSYQF